MPKPMLALSHILILAGTLVGCGGNARSHSDAGSDAGGAGSSGSSAMPENNAGTISESGGSASAGSGADATAAGSLGDGGVAGAAEAFCAQPLSDCATAADFFLRNPEANYCDLSGGIAAMCAPCGPGVAGCLIQTGITHGATYTYLDIKNADVGSRLVYDASGALAAVLAFGANSTPAWRCVAGPSDFDPTEALANPIGQGVFELREQCAADGP